MLHDKQIRTFDFYYVMPFSQSKLLWVVLISCPETKNLEKKVNIVGIRNIHIFHKSTAKGKCDLKFQPNLQGFVGHLYL